LRTLVSLLLVVVTAAGADTSVWRNLATVDHGQRVEVATREGKVKGEFVRFDDSGITVREKQGERSIPQANVSRVSIAKRSRGIWIGAAAGAAGGAIVGSAVGTRLSNESGGDFRNLKPAVTVLTAVAGALIGTVIGASVRQARVIYTRP
jgi:hypothetical protein